MLELGKYSDVSHENVGKYTENKNIDILLHTAQKQNTLPREQKDLSMK